VRRSGRSGRLTRSAEFERVYRRGRRLSGRYVVLYAFPREPRDAPPRLGVVAGKRVGSAVTRNRAKRLLREAFRALGDEAPTGVDCVLVARPELGEEIDELKTEHIEQEIRALTEKLSTHSKPASAQ